MDFSKIDESKEEGEEKLVFHYNREERLKKAPEIVRKYYAGELIQKRGLFRSLVSTRGNRMMFFVLLLSCGLTAFVGFFGPKKNVRSAAGVEFTLTAFSFDDSVYASVKFSEPFQKNRSDYKDKRIPVSAAMSFVDADSQVVFREEASEIYSGKQLFLRTSVTDYDIVKVWADFTFCDEEIHLESPVEHR